MTETNVPQIKEQIQTNAAHTVARAFIRSMDEFAAEKYYGALAARLKRNRRIKLPRWPRFQIQSGGRAQISAPPRSTARPSDHLKTDDGQDYRLSANSNPQTGLKRMSPLERRTWRRRRSR